MHASICRQFSRFLILLAIVPVFAGAQTSLVNINTASLEELDTLPGVGPSIAQKIIDGRPYATVEEISNVQGIGNPGSSTYENIIDLITVGSVSGSGDEGGGESLSNDSPADTSNTSSANSTHYSSTPLSDSKPTKGLSLGIGGDRLGSVGSPLEFSVDASGGRDSDFEWNFGDGFTTSGKTVTHAYEYPGEYVLVVNAKLNDGKAVTRINIKIVEADILVTLATPERIEIKNNSEHEVSLYGRALWSGDRTFVFPKDTIVKARQDISFSAKATGLSPVGGNAIIVTIGSEEMTHTNIAAKVEKEKLNQITSIESQISILQDRLVSAYREQPDLSSPVPITAPVASQLEEGVQSSAVSDDELLTASALEGFLDAEVENKESWLQLLKRFFLRTR